MMICKIQKREGSKDVAIMISSRMFMPFVHYDPVPVALHAIRFAPDLPCCRIIYPSSHAHTRTHNKNKIPQKHAAFAVVVPKIIIIKTEKTVCLPPGCDACDGPGSCVYVIGARVIRYSRWRRCQWVGCPHPKVWQNGEQVLARADA